MPKFIENYIDSFLANPIGVGLITLIVIAGVIIGWKIFISTIRFFHALEKSRKLVYMKVLIPRKESKKDREEQTEKDFKEVIGVMEQLFESTSASLMRRRLSLIFNCMIPLTVRTAPTVLPSRRQSRQRCCCLPPESVELWG